MPRIDNPAAAPVEDTDLHLNDTADRVREGFERTTPHEMRHAESDARNAPRQETTDHVWRRPMNLDAPPPRPGMVQRWVRSEFRNEADNLNWQGKVREGWSPRDPSSVPNAEQLFGNQTLRGQGVIRVGGLILMEAPEQLLKSKRAAIQEITRTQEQSVSVDTDKVSREGMRQGYAPILREEKGEVTTGRQPETLAD